MNDCSVLLVFLLSLGSDCHIRPWYRSLDVRRRYQLSTLSPWVECDEVLLSFLMSSYSTAKMICSSGLPEKEHFSYIIFRSSVCQRHEMFKGITNLPFSIVIYCNTWTTSLASFRCFKCTTWINLLGLITASLCVFLFLSFCCEHHLQFSWALFNGAKKFKILLWKQSRFFYMTTAHGYFAR